MSGKRHVIFVSGLLAPEEKVSEILEPHFNVKIGNPPYSEEAFIREIKDADGILGLGGQGDVVTKRVLQSGLKLKIVGAYGAGVEHIDIQAATELGIIVTNSPFNSQSVAEGSILLMLGSLRHITRVTNYITRGEWKRVKLPQRLLGQELHGKTVGIVGLGRIGACLIRLLKGFEVRILAYDPYVSRDKAAGISAELVDFDTLLKTSDIVSINCALTTETHHLIGKRTLSLMKPTAILVNTSRGGIVDEKALQVALEEGRIAGAGLDVLDPEPPDANNPLLKLDNVFVTAHIAGATVEARERIVTQAAQNFVEVLIYRRLPPSDCIVNPKVLDTKMRARLK